MKINYDTVVGYARTLCAKRDVPQDLVFDIAHDAWIEVSLKLGGDFDAKNRRAFEQRIAFTAILDAIRKHRRWSVADPQHFTESDDGDAAFRAYAAADDWQNPFWLRLFCAERKQMRRDGLKMESRAVTCLLKDARIPLMRAELKLSWPRCGTILKNLQVRFALCFQALRAWREIER